MNIPFFPANEYEIMAKWLIWGSVSQATYILFQRCAETLSTVLKLQNGPWPFCMALSKSLHWHKHFYSAALSLYLFLEFLQWQPRPDRVLDVNLNILLPLFWSTWSRGRGPDLATCAGLANGRDYSYCIASEQKCLKRLGHFISLKCQEYWKSRGLCSGVFNP